MQKLGKVFVTGCAGFIGSTLVDRLLSAGYQVKGFDNFSTGFHRFLENAKQHESFSLVEGDLLDVETLTTAMQGCDFVFHMAANADVRFGLDHPKKDLEQNTIATFNVLEAMRTCKINKIAFCSTGSIYGESDVFPTPENAPFPIQTSLYGASKLACEGLISSYCEGYGFSSWIFRFVSILGERYTHGHVFDFVQRLTEDPKTLMVYGNGKQRKSYLYVQDCIDAIFTAIQSANEPITIVNLGHDTYIEVNDSIRWISQQLGVNPTCQYAGGERGWVGDNPFIYLDNRKMRSYQWQPKWSIEQAVIRTVVWLQENDWVFQGRPESMSVVN